MVQVLVLFVVPVEDLLDNTLNICVQSQNKIVAVNGLNHGLFHIQVVVKISVSPACNAVERIVVILLQSSRSDIP